MAPFSATSPPSALEQVARSLSVFGHPFITIPASVGAVAVLRDGDTRAAMVLGMVFMVLALAMVFGVRTGRFNDFDVSERQRRPGFYLLLTGVAFALALTFRAEPPAARASGIAAFTLLACGVINARTKVSLHTAFSLYAAGFWGSWSLNAGLAAACVAASIAWSRVHLGCHSRSEVLVGAAIGLVAGVCLVLT